MLTVSNLRFGYGPQPILNLPNLTLPQHQHLLVQGASGSGKTSLLFLLGGFLQPTSGHIRLDDTDIPALSPTQRDAFRGRHLGFIFQQPHLMAPLTVRQNLLIANTMAGKAANNARATQLLAKLGLEDLAHRKPHQLSHGQMQRVGIARALMNAPRLVLADEPTSALDDTAAEQVIQLLLATAASEGAQVIVTSHDARLRPHFTNILNLSKAN